MLSLGSSGGSHFLSFLIFPISCNRLETVALSTPSCYASSSWVYDRFSSDNDFKESAFDVCGVPGRCRSLTSKSPALKRRNQYQQVLWDKRPSPSTDHIDLHASTAFFPCWNS
uniref:Secreted protein n=1 Tax=Heterorhabditis bacteriophora TaxID=37862 RepID=A0A1I7WLM3_HETBA